ncbi:MAG: hypothetical protein P4M11_11885 [Candidatus Pacebacteria bacterium]|nr:hypothetical protein [Candidatus Paceibacterota bacterium]
MLTQFDCSYTSSYYFFCYVHYNSLQDFPDMEIELASTTLTIPAANFVSLVCPLSITRYRRHTTTEGLADSSSRFRRRQRTTQWG